MATLCLSRDLLHDYHKLDPTIKKAVDKLMSQFWALSPAQLNAAKGIHLEKHHNQADPRARTVRITKGLRGIVFDVGDGERYILHKILDHDQAERWMATSTFKVNVQVGAVEVWDIHAYEKIRDTAWPEPSPGEKLLFERRPDKHFIQLGIDPDLVPTLRRLTDERQLEGLLQYLPPNQAEALIELTGPDSPDEIYARIAGTYEAGSLDEADVAGALTTPASQAEFHIVTDDDELREMLAKPLAQWRVFLHPSQRRIAYRPSYSGPARVTGGAGTGKTVVAMHRARHLADQLPTRDGKPILFTTFTRNLAQAIRRDLRELGGTELLDVVEVTNVDQLANRIVREAEGTNPRVIQGGELADLWEEVADELGSPFGGAFLANEWEQVVLARGCRSRDDYLRASRAGRGVPLDRRRRIEVWRAVEAAEQKLVERGARTFLQLADAAAGHLRRRTVRPYRHVVVDEAQDLHEAQWRMLREVVAEGPDDLFIVGDSHQRIYDRRASLSRLGIRVVGRSHKLRINYRTSAEILRWSLALLGEETYDDLDEGTDQHDFAGYHSYFHGPTPTATGFRSSHDEYTALTEQIERWVVDGVAEEDIGIAARVNQPLDTLAVLLKKAGIQVCRLDGELPTADGVRLGTMHRLKGLEFRCVAVVDVDDDTVPLRHALADRNTDEVQYRTDLIRERCLLYVACTRAREDLWVGWSGQPSRFLGPVLGVEGG